MIDPDLSVQSAGLVECADALQPGLFWRAHDHMFDMASTAGFTAQSATPFAELLALDVDELAQCSTIANQYAIDAAYGMSLGVSGTPALFVQYGDNEPVQIALALADHFPAIVNAIRPKSTDLVTIEYGDYAGLSTFRRADGGFVLGSPAAAVAIVRIRRLPLPTLPIIHGYGQTIHRRTECARARAQYEFRLYPLVNPQYSTYFAQK